MRMVIPVQLGLKEYRRSSPMSKVACPSGLNLCRWGQTMGSAFRAISYP